MFDQESPGSNCLINIKEEIQVKSEVLELVDVVMDEDSNYDLISITDSTDTDTDGGTEMDPKKVDTAGRLLGECLSLNKRLVVKLNRLPESETEASAREKTLKMTNKVDTQKGRQYKRSSVKHQKVHNFDGKTTKKSNYHDDNDDVDQLIKDCQDNSKKLIVVLERISITIGQTHYQVLHNGVKVKRLKLGNNGDKYPLKLKSTSQAQVDNADKKIICVFCQTEFKDYSSRRTHYENEHKSRWNCKFPKKKYQLNDQFISNTSGGKSFEQKPNLNRHKQLVHTKRPTSEVKCTECDKVLRYKSLQDHQENFHQIFKCPSDNCALTFEGKMKYDQHLIREHENDTNIIERQILSCDLCDKYKTFKIRDLRRHKLHHSRSRTTTSSIKIQSKEGQEDQFISNTSGGKSFAQKPNLNSHKRLVHIKRPTPTSVVKCTECDKFLRLKSLQDHQMKFHQIFKCPSDNCTLLIFEGKMKYDQHLIREHENDPNTTKKRQILSCDLCDKYKTFKIRDLRRHKLGLHSSSSTTSSIKKPNLNRHKRLVHTKSPTPTPEVKCTECDKFLRSKSLQDHQMNFHQIFKCLSDNCTMTFEGKIKYDQHLIREHENDPNTTIERQILSCDLCDKYKTFKIKDLRRHKLHHSSSSSTTNPIKCTLCSKTFKNNYRLKGHLARYHQPFKCTVGDCQMTFKDQGRLDAHVKKHNEKYICHLCSAQVGNFSANINSHMIQKHAVFTCTVDNCGAELQTETQLLVHQQEVHDPELRPGHLCPTCGVSYWTKKTLDRHTLDHKYGKGNKASGTRARRPPNVSKEEYENKKCRFCGKVCNSRFELVNHEKSHERSLKKQKDLEESDEPKFPCSYCDKIYTKKKSLIAHTEMNHTKKPVFKCDFEDCDKIFKANSYLKDHMASKHLKIKFNCTFCTKICTTNQSLSRHMLKVHKNERDYPFKCDVAGCSERFFRNKHLQDHMDQVHTNC